MRKSLQNEVSLRCVVSLLISYEKMNIDKKNHGFFAIFSTRSSLAFLMIFIVIKRTENKTQ